MQRTILIVAALAVGLMLTWTLMFPRNSIPNLPDSPPPGEWFHGAVLEAPETVLVDFSASWCGPCRQLAPMLVKLEQEYEGRLKVVTVDIDEEPELARHFQVDGVPYVYVFRGGKAVAAVRGLIPTYEGLVKFVEPHLSETVVTPPPTTPASPEQVEAAT